MGAGQDDGRRGCSAEAWERAGPRHRRRRRGRRGPVGLRHLRRLRRGALPRPRGAPRSPTRWPTTTGCSRSAAARSSTRPPASLLAGHARGVPAGRPERRREAGRARDLAAAAARQRPRAGSRRCSTSARPIYESVATLVVDTDGRTPGGRRRRRSRGACARERRTTVTAHVGGASPYDVVVGTGPAPAGCRRCSAPACSGSRVLYADGADRAGRAGARTLLRRVATTCWRCRLPDGEEAKTAAVAADCWEALGEAGFTRSDAVVTFGGGATTDLGGFVAATWLRGVRVVHVPDHPARHGRRRGRRQDRHQHRRRARTSSAPSTSRPACSATSTCWRRCRAPSWSRGSARSSSAASSPTRGSSTWSRPTDAGDARPRTPRCCASSSSGRSRSRSTSWSATCKETGGADGHPGREVLNYGHTMAHAIERAEDYRVRHGEAVALGCVYVAELAAPGRDARRPTWSTGTARRSAGSGCRRRTAGASFEDLHATMRVDKKSRGSLLRFVVLDDLARPRVLAGPGEAGPARRRTTCWREVSR